MKNKYNTHFKRIIKNSKDLTIIFDIDGTLVYKQDNVEHPILEKIEYLKRKEIKISIATGRSLLESILIIEQINPNLPVICFDGQLVFDYKNNLIIDNNVLSKDSIKTIKKELNKEYFLILELVNQIYVENKLEQIMFSKAFNISRKHINVINDFALVENANRIYIRDKEFKKIKNNDFLKDLAEAYKLEIQSFSDEWIGLTPCVNKAVGIKTLSDEKHLKKENILFFGDGINDIEVFKYIPLSFAMGNACEEVKKIANYNIDTVHNIGVAKVLQDIINIIDENET